jgi:hypothetical protein
MPSAERSPIWRLAEAVATASELLDTIEAAKPATSAALGFGRLYRYATEPAIDDPTTQAALARDPKLAAAWRRLMQNIALYQAPVAAAAADAGELDRRYGEGWSLRLRDAKGASGQVWVIIALDRPDDTPPGWLFAGTLRQSLPEAVDGQMQFRIGADAPLAQALRDPATELFLL